MKAKIMKMKMKKKNKKIMKNKEIIEAYQYENEKKIMKIIIIMKWK